MTAGITLAHVTRRYGARAALDDVSLAVTPGAVHALVGENGAGKSTLIKVACGLVAPDAGAVRAGDVTLPWGDAAAAIRAGVGVVHQHFMLVPGLTVAENVALGDEPRRGVLGWRVDRDAVRARVRALSAAREMPVDPDAVVDDLAVGERQRVEILKVLYRGATTLLLDEPTAVLSPPEVRALLGAVRALAAGGAAVLFVSHKLDEVFAVADEVTVLRRGRVVLSGPRRALSQDDVTRAVIGDARAPAERARVSLAAPGPVALSLDDVHADGLAGVSLTVRGGEVLGVAGVEGNGQRALAEVIAGLRPVTRGVVRVRGDDAADVGVLARRRRGVGFVPEDRGATGLFDDLTVAENLALGDPDVAGRDGRFDHAAARAAARTVIARFAVRPDDPDARVGDLSGGNQQKVLIGRELARALAVLVVSQPTRGVDLGATAEIHDALRAARRDGVAVVLVSSELDELRALSDRVAVMLRGRVVGAVPVAEASDETLGAWMIQQN